MPPGEAVLVEFGRRQALGIVVAETGEIPSTGAKPIVDRVRADGPLLPPLTLALATWIAARYLSPPALVLRAMLPPAPLPRLELVSQLTPAGARPGDVRRACAARPRTTSRARSGGTGRSGRAVAAAARARSRGACEPRLDAPRGRSRTTLRTLDPGARYGARGRGGP